ncbi:aldo/keto reductase [Cohnella rhizosphaerae]|uniref:Aldo/keto reductase n=1 Tax=Cohnella rhizosphaerae TaxID=1457232 RepID=A0A9X4KWL9_9BACL|nr:aldo/keto reductase [Cohnella rhizosphaerae]MDG0812535.1 aldo/keto reductase [Cohnella rhizosphaerae]
MPFEKRTLGRTGLRVTPIGYGSMELRGDRVWSGRPVDDAEAGRVLNEVLDQGINFIDTAFSYGIAEAAIGKHIAHRRDEYLLATKCGREVIDRGDYVDTPHCWDRRFLTESFEESLRRLKTDYVDLLQLHGPMPEDAERESLVLFLQALKQAGKVRWIGISSFLPAAAHFIRTGEFDTIQMPYSAIERAHESLLSEAAAQGAGVIVRGGVGRGEPGAGLGQQDQWAYWNDANMDELLGAGETRTGFMLRFTLSHPDISTIIIGTKNPAHLRENVAQAQKGKLSPDVYEEAKRRLSAAGSVVAEA